MGKIARCIVVGVLAAGEAVSQDAKSAAEERANFQVICGACHDISMADDLRTQADWKDTIEVMVKAGAKGTPDQFDLVLRYLLHNHTKVNVNSATAAEIAPVLAVSGATAQAIVKWRTEKGAFQTLEELKRVPGVDSATLDARRERIVF